MSGVHQPGAGKSGGADISFDGAVIADTITSDEATANHTSRMAALEWQLAGHNGVQSSPEKQGRGRNRRYRNSAEQGLPPASPN